MATVTLTIDGRAVRVDGGTTVLQAAAALGIRIPTLCHVTGLEPVASCFVCAVQIEGRRTLSPSCALPVADGMVVTTDSADIRRARQVALELLLSDHAGECVAPCAAHCPAALDVPGFLREIVSGDHRRSMEIIVDRLALPGALGRICPRVCEQSCRRSERDEPLAIGALHRYVADADGRAQVRYLPKRAADSDKSVAIIGAGPAGLSAAYFLLRKGHHVTLWDASPDPGGMLRYGIPAYRLPKDALDAEIQVIRALGAHFRMRARWGRDFSLTDLRARFDAVFVAIGAQHAEPLPCPGGEYAISGIELLARVARNEALAIGGAAIVIGGGNTAMDCARSALRLGAREVKIVYRRTRRDMPCLMEEVEDAEAEGVAIEFLVQPVRLERAGDGSLRLTCQRMAPGEPDASGRPRPVPLQGTEFTLSCSTVIAAIGQRVERSLAERDGLQVTSWGIAADERTLTTNLPGVFAGGDAVLGADLAVRAVASGRVAAASIDQYLRGELPIGEPAMTSSALTPIDDDERAAIFRSVETATRVPMPQLPLERRLTTFDEVAGGLPDADALREARRCLNCGCSKADCCELRTLATACDADPHRFPGARRRVSIDVSHPEIVYDAGKCIMCQACVNLTASAGEAVGLTITGRGFDVRVAAPFGESLADGLQVAALLCAAACPTGAITLVDNQPTGSRSARACGRQGF